MDGVVRDLIKCMRDDKLREDHTPVYIKCRLLTKLGLGGR